MFSALIVLRTAPTVSHTPTHLKQKCEIVGDGLEQERGYSLDVGSPRARRDVGVLSLHELAPDSEEEPEMDPLEEPDAMLSDD